MERRAASLGLILRSDWCLVTATLDGEIVARSEKGELDEIITEIRLPLLDANWRTGFYEFSRRAGDFAIATTAVALRIASGKVAEARVGIGGVEDHPFRCAAAEQALVGRAADAAAISEAAEIVSKAVKPMEDLRADAAYRRDLVFTAADLAGVKPIRPMLHRPDYVPVAQPALAAGRVNFLGEAVAVVVVDDAATCASSASSWSRMQAC